MAVTRERKRILILVKTYPMPSDTCRELVCTAGVTELGDWIRLYPVNFRDLPYAQQYRKYQWIEVDVEKHGPSDPRKESYRPICETLRVLGAPLPTDHGAWVERAGYALRDKARSVEELQVRREADQTSLGVIRPKAVTDLRFVPDSPYWKKSALHELQQARLFETRDKSLAPLRKIPFKFQYHFVCDDVRCKGHRLMISDWELGALFWKEADRTGSPEAAAAAVRHKFFTDLCGANHDTHFFLETTKDHPASWIVVGVFYPRNVLHTASLFAP